MDAIRPYADGFMTFVAVHPFVVGTVVVGFALYLFSRMFLTVTYPANIPRVREKPGVRGFSLSTRYALHTDAANLYKEAYENVSAESRSVIETISNYRVCVCVCVCVINPMANYLRVCARAVVFEKGQGCVDSRHWSQGRTHPPSQCHALGASPA
jgi:hypothetical protein